MRLTLLPGIGAAGRSGHALARRPGRRARPAVGAAGRGRDAV